MRKSRHRHLVLNTHNAAKAMTYSSWQQAPYPIVLPNSEMDCDLKCIYFSLDIFQDYDLKHSPSALEFRERPFKTTTNVHVNNIFASVERSMGGPSLQKGGQAFGRS